MLIPVLAAALAAAQPPAAQPPAAPPAGSPPAAPVIPTGEALTAEIAARDADLFETLFARCDPAHMRTLLADDLEFYHDRAGLIRGADAFVADYARNCAGWSAPDAWRSRRALVAGSLVVNPVPGVGAIQAGEHVFYERRGNGPERLAGRARFAQLWVRTPDGWRLSRVFSYGHAAAE